MGANRISGLPAATRKLASNRVRGSSHQHYPNCRRPGLAAVLFQKSELDERLTTPARELLGKGHLAKRDLPGDRLVIHTARIWGRARGIASRRKVLGGITQRDRSLLPRPLSGANIRGPSAFSATNLAKLPTIRLFGGNRRNAHDILIAGPGPGRPKGSGGPLPALSTACRRQCKSEVTDAMRYSQVPSSRCAAFLTSASCRLGRV